MNSLEALGIQQARRVTDDQPAIHISFRHGIPAAVGNGFCAVANELAAIENFLYERMRFEFLKRFMRIEKRISVFEADDHAERDAIIAQAVNPAAAVQIGGERPAERVRDITGVECVRAARPKAP